jgi:hypothetical protein
MMMKTLLKTFLSAALVLFVTTSPAHADKRDKAKILVSHVVSKERFYNDMASAFEPAETCKKDVSKEIGQVIEVVFERKNFYEQAEEMAIAFYSEEFTEEEIDELIAFHQTPLGKKMLSKQTALMKRVQGMLENIFLNDSFMKENFGGIMILGSLKQSNTKIIDEYEGDWLEDIKKGTLGK